jgi:hypothetical protein
LPVRVAALLPASRRDVIERQLVWIVQPAALTPAAVSCKDCAAQVGALLRVLRVQEYARQMQADPCDRFSREHLPLSDGEHVADRFDLFGDVIGIIHNAQPCAGMV